MEVSSHALALHRVDGTRFAAAVFTNLGADHLDLHGTAEEYFRAKASLFTPELAAVGRDQRRRRPRPAAARRRADRRWCRTPWPTPPTSRSRPTTTRFTWRGRRVAVGLGGAFNVANSLAAATTADVLGVDLDAIVAGLAVGDSRARALRARRCRPAVTRPTSS